MNVPPGGSPRHATQERDPSPPDEMGLLDSLDLPLATHPLEIAAALEASGCRDVDAREMGWPDTFSLAEHLFAQQVMHRLAEGEPIVALTGDEVADPSGRQLKDYEDTERHLESQLGLRPQWRVLLKGVLFSLPGLVLAGAMPFPLVRSEALILMATLALSWGLGQGVSFGGYMRVSVSPADARRHMVPWVIGHAAVMAIAMTILVAAGEARPLVGLIAFTQAIYLIAASGLMVLGRERVLYLLLAVGSIAGVHRVIPPVEPMPEPWAAALALMSMASASLVLLWSCRPSKLVRTGGSAPVPKSSLVGHVVYGLTTAAFVLWLPWYGGIGLGLTFLMAPVVLSLGLIEWLLLWLRGVGRRDLAASVDLASFREGVSRSLRVAGASYFAVLMMMVAGSILLVEQVLPTTGLADHAEVPLSIVALGMYLFFAAVAVALFGLRYLLPAALVAALVLAVAPLAVTGWQLALVYGAVCVALALVAYRVALRQVRIPGSLT